jgi:Spy/CpxP family protein refolding chaperone
MSNDEARTETARTRTPRNRLVKTMWLGGIVAALFAAFLLGSLIGPNALASTGGLFGAGGHGCFLRHGRHDALRDAAEAGKHARFAAEWILRTVDATEDQKKRVGTIVESLAADLASVAQEHRGNREAFLQALTGPEIDRAALQRIREAQFGLFDRASTRVVDALADAAEALTPEQRASLIEAAERFHH